MWNARRGSNPSVPALLIVSDDKSRGQAISHALGEGVAARSVQTAADALEALRRNVWSLLVVEAPLSGMAMDEFLHQCQELAPKASCIVLGDEELLAQMEKAEFSDYLFAVLSPSVTKWALNHLIRRALDSVALTEENVRLAWQSQNLYKGSLRAISAALDAKDTYTHGHSFRVTQYSLAIAHQMQLSVADINDIEIGGMLHDIGKIGIPESILQKPGKLTPEEYLVIKSHPMRGYRMLMTLPGMESVLRIVRHHHERTDGNGYPDGLSGDRIPLLARILSVADAYDAMTSNRTYRVAMSHAEAVVEVQRNAGTQFDPQMVKAFIGLREMAEVRKVLEQAPDLPAFSPAVMATQRMLAEAEPELRKLAGVISSDQAMTGKVLRLVNSAHYSLSRTVSDVGQAVALIGLNDLHRILVTIAAQPLLSGRKGYDLWFHSLSCAISAEMLARRTSDADPGEAFTAGLLHDVGISLLQRYFPGSYERAITLEHSGTAGFSSEVVVFGVDHATVGAWLLETWGLDASLCDAVRYHHDPYMATNPLCFLIALANSLAHGLDPKPSLRSIDGDWLERFHLAPEEINGFLQEVRERTAEFTASVQPAMIGSS
jgi:putative nucleotidyltransferase with HDIG domain